MRDPRIEPLRARGSAARARRAAAIARAGLAMVAVLALGCEEQGASSATGEDSPASSLASAWKQAGLEATEFKAMAGAGIAGGECVAGKVNQLDTVLCRYKDAQAARAARPAGLTYIGQTTGVSLPRGPHLLVVTDRDQADPAGKAIDKIAKAFLAIDPAPAEDSAAGDEPAAAHAEVPDMAKKPASSE